VITTPETCFRSSWPNPGKGDTYKLGGQYMPTPAVYVTQRYCVHLQSRCPKSTEIKYNTRCNDGNKLFEQTV